MKTLIKRITDCAMKRSDHNNGYYIQAETWGSCFHRFLTSEKRGFEIDMTYELKPKYLHTYTKFPKRFAHNVFHVYVNYPQEEHVMLLLAAGARVIGFDHPQTSGQYLNRSFLVYSPSGAAPEVFIQEKTNFAPEQFSTQIGIENPVYLQDIDTIFRGKKIQKIWLNADGYQTIYELRGKDTRSEFPNEITHSPVKS